MTLRQSHAADIEMLNGFICYMEVADIGEAIARIGRSGGTAGESVAVPSYCWYAYCMDTEGNHIGVLQFDDTAGATGH
jgi:predicted enzyme related to lactoylglutathione lyase